MTIAKMWARASGVGWRHRFEIFAICDDGSVECQASHWNRRLWSDGTPLLRPPDYLDHALSLNLPKNCRLHHLSVRGDARGSLIALEGGHDVPFDVARIYYIFGNNPGVERGFHAHERLTQWAICVSGSCVMRIDDGTTRADVTLDRPDLAIEIGSMIWREMRDFSPDAVLLVLASAHYDVGDYIRDYDVFLAKARG